MTFDQWTDELLLALLEEEEATEQFGSDLELICRNKGLSDNEDWLSRFIHEARIFGQGNSLEGYYFTLDANGRYQAKTIREAREANSIKGKIKSIQRSDWISLGALLVSIIALFKSN